MPLRQTAGAFGNQRASLGFGGGDWSDSGMKPLFRALVAPAFDRVLEVFNPNGVLRFPSAFANFKVQ
jgi:hypothetical protein